MEKALFSITCTTCQARLRVCKEEAIGVILECPKCGSMVEVLPPEDRDDDPTPNTEDVLPAGVSVSPSELLWRKWLLLGAAPVVGLIIVLAVWSIFFSSREPEPAATPVVEQPTPKEQALESPPVEPEPEPPPAAAADVLDTPAAAEIEPAVVEPEVPAVAEEELPPDAPDPDPVPLPTEPVEAEPAQPQPDPITPPPQPVVAGPTPPKIDLQARLADTIPEFELQGMPLAEAVGLLSAMSTLPITLDPDALFQLDVGLRDSISVQSSEATVEQILHDVVVRRGLAVVVDEGQVLITSPVEHRRKLRPRRYTVSDLTGEDPAAVAELAAMVEKLVAPDSWRAVGGPGTIQPQDGTLAVTQTGVVHHQILVFCEKLRTARGLPLRSRQSAERFALATRRHRIEKLLAKPVTVNFHEPAPLIEILAYLGRLAEIDILLDRPALAAGGLFDRSEARLTVHEQPAAVALKELLGSLGLAYRAVESGVLQVSTYRAVAARMELEFYLVGDLLTDGQTPETLIENVIRRVVPDAWDQVGGPGVVHFDRRSNCLIVLQSQLVQEAVERLLAEKRP